MGDERLPRRVLLGELEEAAEGRRTATRLGAPKRRGPCGANHGDEKGEDMSKTSAKDLEGWYAKVEGGVAWFMRKLQRKQLEASEKRQEARGQEKDGDQHPPKKRKGGSGAEVDRRKTEGGQGRSSGRKEHEQDP